MIMSNECNVGEVFGVIQALFSQFIIAPIDEIAVVMQLDDASDYCIAGTLNPESEFGTFIRGDLSTIVVPLSFFTPSGGGTSPDFDKFSIIDCQTLRFGEYEAAFDAALYMYDIQYRRKINKRRRPEDRSFGASIRRLRLGRQFQQDEIEGVTKKTIGRIERGEVEPPTGVTLEALSKALGVPEEALGTY